MPAYEYRAPTETTAPVAGTTAGVYTFATPAGRVVIDNRSGTPAYIRLNSASAASVATHDFIVGADCEQVLAHDEIGTSLSIVGVWIPANGAVTSFKIRGL